MFYLELLFLMQCLLGIFMMCFLRKINQVKKQLDNITKEVKEYLIFIEEDIGQDAQKETENLSSKPSKDEVQNRLIQAVLQEYFP